MRSSKRLRDLVLVTLGGLSLFTASTFAQLSDAAASSPALSVSTAVQVQKVDVPGTWVDTNLVYEGSAAKAVVSILGLALGSTGTISVQRSDGALLGQVSLESTRNSSTFSVPLNLEGAAWAAPGVAAASGALVNIKLASGQTVTQPVALSVAPRPLVLLHGLWSSASTWALYQGFVEGVHPLWRAYAVGDGAYPGTMNTGALTSPLQKPNSVDTNANEAWTYISAVRKALNANEVDLVGHSMGGIVARRLLYAQGQAAQDAVRDVVMLGTPNGGSYCAVDWPVAATAPLIPATMREFNQRNPGYPGVNSTLVYAEHLAPTCLDFSRGDSVVPRWSAKSVAVDHLYVSAPVLHASMPADRAMFDRFVAPTLARTATQGAPTSSTVNTSTEPVPDEETISQLAKHGLQSAGAQIAIPITVVAGERLSVSVVSSHDPDGLLLVGPDGTSKSLTRVSKQQPVFTATLPSFRKGGTAYLRGNSDAGFEWSFSVSNSDVTIDASVQEKDGVITIKADLTDPDAAKVKTVRAFIVDESNDDRTTARLNDAGSVGDARANDGVFSAKRKVGAEEGEEVRVEVTASFADGRQRSVMVGYLGS